jgi:hypothetical protein
MLNEQNKTRLVHLIKTMDDADPLVGGVGAGAFDEDVRRTIYVGNSFVPACGNPISLCGN